VSRHLDNPHVFLSNVLRLQTSELWEQIVYKDYIYWTMWECNECL